MMKTKILEIIKDESENADVRKYTCINGFGYSQLERNIAERVVKLFAIPRVTASCCPKCGALEIDAMTPRTIYKCGSSDYDQRPNTFKQTIKCKVHAFFNWR